jgi:hypothetical protein
MPINSPAELQRALSQVQSLDPADVAVIAGSAHYNASGRLDGIYAGPLVAKSSPAEINDFLTAVERPRRNRTPAGPAPAAIPRSSRNRTDLLAYPSLVLSFPKNDSGGKQVLSPSGFRRTVAAKRDAKEGK